MARLIEGGTDYLAIFDARLQSDWDGWEDPEDWMDMYRALASATMMDQTDPTQAEHDPCSERESELAEALDAYTDPTHPEYDPVFDR